MANGEDLIALAHKHLGEKYVLGAFAPKDNAHWLGPWDCAEFASWLTFQSTGMLLGCTDNSDPPNLANAYSGSWARDAVQSGKLISIGEAKNMAGSVLIRKPSQGRGMGHVAISNGDSTTVEAHSTARGVIRDQIDQRRWDFAMLLPGLTYNFDVAEGN
ncbi:MAG TPA: hypothetical protein VNQ97_01860, partial [Burkholderiaceae bacterium]|nr:hypothetical protein [Burkholderiaceae bacterium]